MCNRPGPIRGARHAHLTACNSGRSNCRMRTARFARPSGTDQNDVRPRGRSVTALRAFGQRWRVHDRAVGNRRRVDDRAIGKRRWLALREGGKRRRIALRAVGNRRCVHDRTAGNRRKLAHREGRDGRRLARRAVGEGRRVTIGQSGSVGASTIGQSGSVGGQQSGQHAALPFVLQPVIIRAASRPTTTSDIPLTFMSLSFAETSHHLSRWIIRSRRQIGTLLRSQLTIPCRAGHPPDPSCPGPTARELLRLAPAGGELAPRQRDLVEDLAVVVDDLAGHRRVGLGRVEAELAERVEPRSSEELRGLVRAPRGRAACMPPRLPGSNS